MSGIQTQYNWGRQDAIATILRYLWDRAALVRHENSTSFRAEAAAQELLRARRWVISRFEVDDDIQPAPVGDNNRSQGDG